MTAARFSSRTSRWAGICFAAAAVLWAGAVFGQNVQAEQKPGSGQPPASQADNHPPAHKPFVEPITAAKIRQAVDDAVAYLRSCQKPNGSIGDGGPQGPGDSVLATLAMLAASGDPAGDASLGKAVEWVAQLDTDNTYVRGLRANVWEYALRQSPNNARFRRLLGEDSQWLLKALGKKEGWRYTLNSPDWDNSCTQYGVLGLWAAARAGLDPGLPTWLRLSKHFRSCQGKDGSWAYAPGSNPSASMTAAGLASMFLVLDMCLGKAAYSAKEPNPFAAAEAMDSLHSIEAGMNWLGKIQEPGKSGGYYLYGIERTGVASGRKYIGGEDWFARGAAMILARQAANGSFTGSYGAVVETSFVTLFLVYGGAPVAFNKLEYGPDQDWNLNPRDLANLCRRLWSAYERPINWYSVSISKPAASSEFEAPILFISGSKAAEFNEEETLKLRDYVLGGGTILTEPSDHSKAFADSMAALLEHMFPADEYGPEYKLQPLPASHPIYTVGREEWKDRPELFGASDGSRTFFLLSGGYLSGDWQTNRSDSDALKLAMNLLFYATDRGDLAGRFASVLPDTPPAKERNRTIRVARVKHTGDERHPRDWDAAAACWKRFAPYARHITGCKLAEGDPVALGMDKLDGVDLLHITGRGELKLSAEERDALRGFVESGGAVLVDAYAGSPGFARSAKLELVAIFGGLSPLPADDPLATGTGAKGDKLDGGADLAQANFKLAARQLLSQRGQPTRGQKLLVWRGPAPSTRPEPAAVIVEAPPVVTSREGSADGQDGGDKNPPAEKKRPGLVLFSEFDLAASMAGIENYRSLGYTGESARKVVGNLLLYLAGE